MKIHLPYKDGTKLNLRLDIISIWASVTMFLGLFRASLRKISDILGICVVLNYSNLKHKMFLV